MSSLKLAMIQGALIWESPEENRSMFEKKISSLKEVDLIVLPEMFTTGFTMRTKELGEQAYGPTHLWMQEWSARSGAVITGSYIVSEGDMHFNRLMWVEPDGSFQQYNKKHLFRMADEHLHYTPGNSRLITQIRDWKILPLVCYDLRFPAWCRNHYHPETKQLDYDLALFVANWPEVRSDAWDALLKSRAIENHAYCAGLNRIGKDGLRKSYNGHSACYSPKGETISWAENEQILYFTLEKGPLEEYRKKFPAFLDSND